MTAEEALNLRLGDRVAFPLRDGANGVVAELSPFLVKFNLNSGRIIILDRNRLHNVSVIAKPETENGP